MADDAAARHGLWRHLRPDDDGQRRRVRLLARPAGHMYALDGATGEILWSFASGGSCLSGAAISNGTLFWGSGYSNFGFGTPNNKLYAFGLPG